MALGIAEALLAALAFGVAALLQAMAARRAGGGGALDIRLLLHMLRDRVFVGALVLNLVGFALHFSALRMLPAFLVQSMISSSVVVTALLSARFLGVALARADYAAVLCVALGLVLCSLAGGESHTATTSLAWRAGLVAVTAGIVVAGLLAGRLRGGTATLVLGAVAGLGFAVVAISARVLPSFAPSTLVTDPATLALVASGCVAFMLYTAAFQRGSAVVATAAVVLFQTAGPSLVGLLLLGDQVRAGRAPLLVVGLALAFGGAVALARFDAASLGGADEAQPATASR